MKILLLNNNPVVNKLVTLSAQKTSNSLDVCDDVGVVESKNYDLLIVDDALYSEEAMDELNNKIKYEKSLYICSKDAKYAEEFTKVLKKPFLPTDLVEILITLTKDMGSVNLEDVQSSADFDEVDTTLHNLDLDDLEELEELEAVDDFEDMDGFETKALENNPNSEDIDFDSLEEDEVELDDLEQDIDFDSEDVNFEDEDNFDLELNQNKTDSVLDKDELKEVKTLLEENEMEEFDSDDLDFDEVESVESKEALLEAEDEIEDDVFDELDLGDDSELGNIDKAEFQDLSGESFLNESQETKIEDEADSDDSLEFEDDFDLQESQKDEEALNLEDSEEFTFGKDNDDILSLDDESDEVSDISDFDENLDEDNEESVAEGNIDNLEDLESQIESAVKELSDEDLESEVDEDMLMDIDSLTSRDLKLAIGEEISVDDELDEEQEVGVSNDNSEDMTQAQESKKDSDESSNDGVEALKKLLKALSNEDVAASLKGMKININITLGDK